LKTPTPYREMTSIIRSYSSAPSLPAAPGFIPAFFTNSDGFRQPFPWRFDRKTQAIDLDYVDGFTNSTAIGKQNMFFRGQQFGAVKLVLKLGPKFTEWCENNSSINADAGTVQLYENPVVVNANMVASGQTPSDADTDERDVPISFESGAGSAEGKFCKTLVFMKPMVITYLRSGTRYYRWFNQNFEGSI